MAKERSIGSVQDLGGGKYRLRVSAGYDDFGRRIQPSKVVEAKSQTDAEKQLLKLYNETQGNAVTIKKDAPKTLGALYEEFKKDHVSGLRPNTQDYYMHTWKKHLQPFEKAKLSIISPKHIRAIMHGLPSTGKIKKSVYGMLNTMFRFASVDNDYMRENPCAKVKPPEYKAPEKRVLDKTEVSEIFKLIQAETPERQLSFILGVTCGMRRGEVMGLEWNDIDFSAKIIRIRRAAGRSKELGSYIDATKNRSSERAVALPDLAVPVLHQIKAQQAEGSEQLGTKWIDNDFIFRSWNGERMKVEFPTHWWTEFRNAHGIDPSLTFHSLRHTAATHMIASNIPISTVAGVLGHAQISTTTNIYAHVLEDTKAGAVRVMEDILEVDA